MTGPCEPLITTAELTSCCDITIGDEDGETPASLVNQAIEVTSFLGWALTGRRYGVCETKERPTRLNRRRCCGGGGGVPCPPASVLLLSHTPVVSITTVTLGGDTLVVDTDWRLAEPNRLVRVGDKWPPCPYEALPDDDPKVVVVTYKHGIVPDELGKTAMAKWACEFIKACNGDEDCSLPAGVRSVSRQGIDMTMIDPFDFLEDGRTGQYDMDVWVNTVNPGKKTRRSRVRSPDLTRAVEFRQ